MKTLIVPYDFSTEAEFALNTAIQLAKIQEATIKLIHVVEVPSGYLSLYPEYGGFQMENLYNDQIIKVLEDKLNHVVEKHLSGDLMISGDLLYGKPFDSIQKTIVSEQADLIVMGSKGASGLKEIFVGSNTERVIRYSEVPVLTVKHEVDFSQMSEMVFATDFSDNKSIKLAKDLQKMLGLKMKLLKVYNSSDWAYTEDTAIERIQEFAKYHHFKDYTYHVYDSPFVTDGILHFSEKEKADLIVMGTHGYTGIGHLIAGSNAESVANHTKIPIFTVRV
ncbi:universal stress protein [Marinoscillum sp. MHG1-6]|uniref:universal stress protein n=1 Tax=Marinoscillum sp. MHG1-6 TaxID=2959627 RepID=UPI002158782B|nr:universal stress protein [Marinoscillum sp. MHG1-6]